VLVAHLGGIALHTGRPRGAEDHTVGLARTRVLCHAGSPSGRYCMGVSCRGMLRTFGSGAHLERVPGMVVDHMVGTPCDTGGGVVHSVSLGGRKAPGGLGDRQWEVA